MGVARGAVLPVQFAPGKVLEVLVREIPIPERRVAASQNACDSFARFPFPPLSSRCWIVSLHTFTRPTCSARYASLIPPSLYVPISSLTLPLRDINTAALDTDTTTTARSLAYTLTARKASSTCLRTQRSER